MDIEGNERADEEAKRAAREHTGEIVGKELKSAMITDIKKTIENHARERWRKGKEGAQHHQKISTPAYFKTGKKIYNDLTRREATTLARLRTGHCGLNLYLSKRKIIEDATCECGRGAETVKHFLLDCERFKTQRQALQAKIGQRHMREERLLGDKRWVKHTINYVMETERFEE